MLLRVLKTVVTQTTAKIQLVKCWIVIIFKYLDDLEAERAVEAELGNVSDM